MSQAPCLQYLKDYVAIPSVNPMGRSDIDESIIGERRLAEHLREQLRRIGLDAEVVGEGDRQSVVASATTRDAHDTLMVASHIDTVPVDSMEIDPFDPAVEGGLLYGRGSCDTKAGMAALIEALERVLRDGRLRRNVVVVGEADEEYASVGVQDVLTHMSARPPDWVLATEPTEMQLVTHHKGIVLARVEAHGRACHSSDPGAGRNAIVALAGAVQALEELSRQLASRPDRLLGPSTLSIGVIQGGQSPNIVPDHAWMLVDRRVLASEDADTVRADLEAALADHGIEHVEVTRCFEAKPPLATTPDSAAVTACRSALTRMSLPTTLGAVGFATDGGVFSRRGIPSVVMGPGSIAQAHTDREFVEMRQVEDMVKFFEHLLSSAGATER